MCAYHSELRLASVIKGKSFRKHRYSRKNMTNLDKALNDCQNNKNKEKQGDDIQFTHTKTQPHPHLTRTSPAPHPPHSVNRGYPMSMTPFYGVQTSPATSPAPHLPLTCQICVSHIRRWPGKSRKSITKTCYQRFLRELNMICMNLVARWDVRSSLVGLLGMQLG